MIGRAPFCVPAPCSNGIGEPCVVGRTIRFEPESLFLVLDVKS